MVYAHDFGNIDEETLERFCYIGNSGFSDSEKEYSAIVLRNQLINIPCRSKRESKGIFLNAQAAIYDFSRGISRKKVYRNDVCLFK